jgi:hypothetical protein
MYIHRLLEMRGMGYNGHKGAVAVAGRYFWKVQVACC